MPISSDTAQHLLGEMFHIGRALRSALFFTDAGQLPPGGIAVLTTLDASGPCRQVDLAADMRITQSALSRHITELVAAGYIVRRADPSDGRAALVQLTSEGLDLLNRARETHTRHLQETLDDWSEDDAEQAYLVVRRLRNSLNARSRCASTGENPQVPKESTDV
ncbi:MarR family winged helix-turn-helix transcriptional regulator [Nocardia carnea]|uniref:MarR family winged helix-turn-helix transcriptional regulator n=1 Tax=Nocardia carnea TaxID=37328 RepID=UPI002457EADA|nr:MarR family transcriptional regulator [Nocardia carnea]